MPALQLHPDRLFPPDPATRDVARELYRSVRDLPIISPHGHVDPRILAEDTPFPDPTSLLISPDHYVTRLLHSSGVGLDELGVAAGSPLDEGTARKAWRIFCERWPVYRGTPVQYWFESELHDIFGVRERPAQANADDLFDRISAALRTPEFRPRALYRRFGIEVLATTDDPADDLHWHRVLRDDPSWDGRVIPTFRPDRYLEPAGDGWPAAVAALGAAADTDTGDYRGFLTALRRRRRYFVDHGATSADHSHADVGTEPLDETVAADIFARALRREASTAEATALRRHLLFEMAAMSAEDGLVMTLHPGILRNHHRPTYERFGPDRGHDIPTGIELTEALRPLLQRFGTSSGFHLVVFTTDETVFSRQRAPLAGFYPSVYVGAPWWFLDAPDAIGRWRSAVTETAGFSRTSGFIDDTRAFCSIPARHDMSRRLDAAHLADLVVRHRLAEDEAGDTIRALVQDNPRAVFKL
ncbi:Uronate isomerase [Pseudonocardia sp. Ae168_Ps1]|uniref:glucuronate isomerase n=1 Tax=unclassified Pseudonocardia TaxID=2619320 RepID=UPI00094B25F0|nr:MULTISPECIES: glucuronate isomerase [unclassified Pseudonocardia]OLL72031.1 Uronate isomerase [Pseudonocardia sp. Ae150A_Ps1]OLL77997.1 Uronate isomerase [Pseudonocardia sp. Ae168_Ps1]OLL87879.1 Uronate isomerase [Pseudonocardia sp. Ae263_Ps1]OLL92096.1 Uronate isomerase [Pseudonocardia sp. Ae356_Ps1]